MRILYIDVDSLRPDHLGCYGYGRNTSPNIDALANLPGAVRFEQCYIPDAPCLPSRTALWSGRAGYRTGVVNHGGVASEPFREGPGRGHRDLFDRTGWMGALRAAGLRTATISSFGERHSAWHWYAGYNEVYNPGLRGMDVAYQATPIALEWLGRNAASDGWFLHVNYWDPHTPYRTPEEFGDPFKNDPLPEWLTEDVRLRLWEGFGPHSPQEPTGFRDFPPDSRYPRSPSQIDSPESLRRWMDGYDTGIRYADEHIGYLLEALDRAGVLDDTTIMLSADHGENQGELNVWGDHQTADPITCRVPLIVRVPGVGAAPRVDGAFHYQYDWAATLIELAGGAVPENWDGAPFTEAFREGRDEGRPYVVTSQNVWSCQKGVRWDRYVCLRTYHDGYKDLAPVLLFDVEADPHEQQDLSGERPELVAHAMGLLAEEQHRLALAGEHDVDPMLTVLREGGPFYTRGLLPGYLERLRATGRGAGADLLASRHADELARLRA